MHGPPRTQTELGATLDHEVKHLTQRGIKIDPAIRLVADRHGLGLIRVAVLINSARRRRRECLSGSSST